MTVLVATSNNDDATRNEALILSWEDEIAAALRQRGATSEPAGTA